jgi:hypothetical protein
MVSSVMRRPITAPQGDQGAGGRTTIAAPACDPGGEFESGVGILHEADAGAFSMVVIPRTHDRGRARGGLGYPAPSPNGQSGRITLTWGTWREFVVVGVVDVGILELDDDGSAAVEWEIMRENRCLTVEVRDRISDRRSVAHLRLPSATRGQSDP